MCLRWVALCIAADRFSSGVIRVFFVLVIDYDNLSLDVFTGLEISTACFTRSFFCVVTIGEDCGKVDKWSKFRDKIEMVQASNEEEAADRLSGGGDLRGFCNR